MLLTHIVLRVVRYVQKDFLSCQPRQKAQYFTRVSTQVFRTL